MSMTRDFKPLKKQDDGLDDICGRMMQQLRKDYRGCKAEISPHMLIKTTKRFTTAYGMSHKQLLDALIRRGWFEPSAGDTYIIRYDLVRK